MKKNNLINTKTMKIISILLFVGFALSGYSQSTAEIHAEKRVPDDFEFYSFSQHDTISTSSTTFNQSMTLSQVLYGNYDCACSIVADSLSGGTTGTATIQGSADPDGGEWQTIGTVVTIDGVETKSGQTFQLYYPRLRVNVAAGSSTQSTRVRVEIACKKRYDN